MAIISIYIPDSGVGRVYDAICAHYRYQPEVQNPNGGQNLVQWAADIEHNIDLLPVASGKGYSGVLPGTEIESGVYAPVIPPFVEGVSGLLGVITGVTPYNIPNPQTKAEFTNGVIRGFLAEHTKVYELDEARKQAEAAASGAGNVPVDDGSTATVYDYDMVCLAPAKDQYNALAQVIAPGNTFNVALSANGEAPATHYGVEAGITEQARQQLLVLELAGGTTTGGVQTLFYTRCDPTTHIGQSTNIDGYNIVGQQCSFSNLLNHLGLKEIVG